MRLARSLAFFCASLLLAASAGAQDSAPAHNGHYVVLLSLSGFRYDYSDAAKNLMALGKHGASAPEGILPGYPAFASPNEYAIVTGLYPGHSGIIADDFIDPATQKHFAADDAKLAADSSWYSGTPLWSLAEQQGVRTACIHWAGCAAPLAGFRPAYFNGERLEPAAVFRQIVAWLHLPAAQRPRFIAAELTEPGDSALKFGPDAPETRAAVRRVDVQIGKLRAELDATHLPIDLVVVSDRGLAKPDGGWIALDQFAGLTGFESAGTLLYGKTEEDRARIYSQLKKATSEFFVYRLKNLPAELGGRNPRMGDPVIFPTGSYAIRAHATADSPPHAVDGFDPRLVPQMKGIFFAAGPDIVEGRTVAPFENVNLYPWLAHLLGLIPPKTDGSLNILSGTLRDNGDETSK